MDKSVVVQGGEAEFRPVETGITGSTHIAVRKGIGEGEEIVTGSYKVLRTIRSGTRVKVENNEGESSGWW